MTEEAGAANGAGDSSESTVNVDGKVVKQIEYYFGDINLMRDRFLKEKIQEDDGWVTIETMLKFNRLREITEDGKVICEALKSKSSLMEVSEDGTKMRRNPSKPLPGDTKERREDLTARTVYAKPFPLDVKLDALMTFFETYGPIDNVYMKRDFHKKTFKGSVFATFVNKDDADKFVKEEGTKFNDQALEMKSFKTDYFKEKQNSRKSKGKKENKDDTKKEGSADGKKDTAEDEEEKARNQMTKGAVLHISGMDPATSREEIRTFFSSHGDVGWVDFDKGVTEGYVRLKEPNSAETTLEKAKTAGEGKLVILEKELTVRVVEGDEELEYWKKMFRDIAERNRNKNQNRQGGRDRGQRGRNRGGGRGGRGGRDRRNRGGPQGKRHKKDRGDSDGDSDGQEEESEEPPAKTQKTEEVAE